VFDRLGKWCYTNRRSVLLAWIAIAVFTFAFGSTIIGASFDGQQQIPDSETKRGGEVLDEHFGGLGTGARGSLVFQTDAGYDDPEVQAAMEVLFAEVGEIDGLTVTSPYEGLGPATQVATEGEFAGRVAYASIDIDSELDETETSELGGELRTLVADAEAAVPGLRVELGGAAFGEFEPPETELIGLAFAVVVLIISFGSVLAMGLPIGVALTGLITGFGLIFLISNVVQMPSFAPTIAAMVGLGVGIDYALFIVTRFREATARGSSNLEAVGEAIDTAGRAVLFAGMTVVLSLLGMLLMGLPFVAGLGIAASLTVLTTMIASLTLLPALLGYAGDRVEVTRWRGLVAAGLFSVALLGAGLGVQALLIGAPLALVVLLLGRFVPPLAAQVPPRREKPLRETFAYRWSRVIQRSPWVWALVSGGLLLIMAAPVLSLRLGFSDEGNLSEETTTRQAYDLLAEAFGPGFNGPFIMVTELENPEQAANFAELAEAVGATDGVARVIGPFPNDLQSPTAAVAQVFPTTAPQDQETVELLETLRSEVVPGAISDNSAEVNFTGFTAAGVDFTDYLQTRVPLFIGVVLALSFVLLMMVFRSLLVPLKAVIMNMLSIAAAYGVVTVIFQWGWGASLFGIDPGAPVEPFVPMMIFAIVFGLSMDYEVFLLSRVREEYSRTGDAVASVADGLAATARVITAAAAIMVVVFGSFLLEDDRIVKLFGTGLAVAVLLDATLVRMVLVPSTMELLGARNWWLPRWLDRLLPNLDVEGGANHTNHTNPVDQSQLEPAVPAN
jgi:RND superfamily putative drug exporter